MPLRGAERAFGSTSHTLPGLARGLVAQGYGRFDHVAVGTHAQRAQRRALDLTWYRYDRFTGALHGGPDERARYAQHDATDRFALARPPAAPPALYALDGSPLPLAPLVARSTHAAWALDAPRLLALAPPLDARSERPVVHLADAEARAPYARVELHRGLRSPAPAGLRPRFPPLAALGPAARWFALSHRTFGLLLWTEREGLSQQHAALAREAVALAPCPDGLLVLDARGALVVLALRGDGVRFVDAPRTLATLGPAAHATLAPDGAYALLADESAVWSYDRATARVRRAEAGLGGAVRMLRADPSGTRLAVGLADARARVLSTRDGATLQQLEPAQAEHVLEHLAFAPEGDALYALSRLRTAPRWTSAGGALLRFDLRTGMPDAPTAAPRPFALAFGVCPRGAWAYAVHAPSLPAWGASQWSAYALRREGTPLVRGGVANTLPWLAFSADGAELRVLYTDGTPRVARYDALDEALALREAERPLRPSLGAVPHVSRVRGAVHRLSRDGALVVLTRSLDEGVRVLRFDDGANVCTLAGTDAGAAWSGWRGSLRVGSRALLWRTGPRTATAWDLWSGAVVERFELAAEACDELTALALSHDERTAWFGTARGALYEAPLALDPHTPDPR